MGRFVPITVTTVAGAEKPSQFKVTGGKALYDGKQCWQYKVVYDRPGTYTFTVPTGAICARTVIVGGGGKPICSGADCRGYAGAGGAYSEKCHAVTGGTTAFTIVVGRQHGDSTVACNGTAVHTAGGAVGCAPGAASGGNWNSKGGCGGFSCAYCGGSYSQCHGTCIRISPTTCCGYCIVYAFNCGCSSGNGCYNMNLPGGGSAGSPRYNCGGDGMCTCTSGSLTHGPVAGGGGGLGSQCPMGTGNSWHYSCCDCVCLRWDGNAGGWCAFMTCMPGSAGGGGGSHGPQPKMCRSWEGTCVAHHWQGGQGGPGGPGICKNDAMPNCWNLTSRCRRNESYGSDCPIGRINFRPKDRDPCKKDWWDICDISGAGSPGHTNEVNCIWCCSATQMSGFWGRPSNSGEGAGSGGIAFYCCDSYIFGDAWPCLPNSSPADLINWCLICCLGAVADPFRCDAAYAMKDKLFSGSVTCSGTLGGSGGVNVCGFNSKAGFGGGGGTAKCHIVCVCYGGTFDCCNGSLPALAFPPCILDNLVSNAGSGLAIVYYKEA